MQQTSISEGQEIDIITQDKRKLRFSLTKQVGAGSQGFVFFARQKDLDKDQFSQEVAMKFVNKLQVLQQELDFLQQIRNYQNSQNELTFPSNIIKIIDFFYFNEYFITVMEKANRSLLQIHEKIKICFDINYPVYFLHANKLMHRDLKPENYLKTLDLLEKLQMIAENIQNILNTSQGFQQYQNIVENPISEHDLGNIY